MEYWQGHINKDETVNDGSIVASIIGGILLFVLTIYIMCKAIRSRNVGTAKAKTS